MDTNASTLVRLPSVLALTGLSRTEIYRRVAKGDFPRPVKLGSSSVWPEGEVIAWIAARIADRNGKPA